MLYFVRDRSRRQSPPAGQPDAGMKMVALLLLSIPPSCFGANDMLAGIVLVSKEELTSS